MSDDGGEAQSSGTSVRKFGRFFAWCVIVILLAVVVLIVTMLTDSAVGAVVAVLGAWLSLRLMGPE